jgi:F-type H+-transporting ATPase subunit epsilon
VAQGHAQDATALALTVATPAGMQLDLSVESVQLPGVNGEFGILPNHVELLAALKPGVVRYKKDGQTLIAAIGAGYSEADARHVRVITEFFARPQDVSVEKAKADQAKAEAKLKNLVLGEADQVEAQNALDWALARIEIAHSGSAAH